MGILGGDLFNNDGRNRALEYDMLLKDFSNVYDEYDNHGNLTNRTMNELRKAPSLDSFLQGYDAMDRNSLTPVVSSGLFQGLQEYTVRLVSRLIEFRENVSVCYHPSCPCERCLYSITVLVPRDGDRVSPTQCSLSHHSYSYGERVYFSSGVY